MFSNKMAAWAILAAFLLSFVPTATAGGDYDEWFYWIEGDTTDEDGDGYNDTATVGYDPDTTCECDVDIYVYITVYDNDTGDEVDSGSFEYTINNGEGDWFEEDWTPDYNGTFDFNITLYDDEGYLEDYADWYDVELWAMTGSTDETINVENGVFDEDEDQLMNDLGFYVHVKDDEVEGVNITVLKKNILGIWTFFNNGTTDEDGELTFNNITSGEYMWDASVGGEQLANEGGYALVDDTYTMGHVGTIEDWDGADDWDDFMAFVPEGNGTKDDAYVEVFDENGTMVDNGTTDDESWGDDHFFISDDLAQGNYTHYIYEEQGGDLLQNGSFYSYGSTSTNYDEWFEDWDYETEDTNGDFEDDTINISFDPDTECDCEVDINVMIEVFENETGDGVDWAFGEFTINGTADDWFSMNWTATDNGSYDFNVTLFDDDWNFEDQFRIEDVYLTNGGGGGGGQGDEDEWFYDWDYSTEDTNEDDEDDTIVIGYDPDTTCDCEVNITVDVDVYDNETGDWVDYTYAEHTIYDEESDWFEQDWTATDNGSYDFFVVMYDEDWNQEDDFWLYNVSLTSGSGGNGTGDEDEWFYDWDYSTEDTNDDDEDDTIVIGYDPDTTCDCEVDITVYIDVYDNETGDWVDGIDAEHTIYDGEGDWFEQDWTPYENGSYDFNAVMYDEDWNQEDEFWIYDVYLSSDDGGGGGNGTGDDNGVGHVGIIDDWEEDGFVNDYIGGVLEDDEFKEDAYFEIYDEDGNLVDSGNPNYFDVLFVSYNLTEGWYYQDVYYEEDDALLQTGPFYSYGNSSNPETSDTVNVDNLVVDEDEYAVYDDVGFIAHRGNTSTGESGVEIDIYKYNETSDDYEYHAYVETNETGEAWLYNETCGEYEWYVSEDENGYYEVWAHCDDNGGGGGNGDEDEWFYDWDYETEDMRFVVGYDPDTTCDCEVDITVYVDVYDNENGDYVDYTWAAHAINDGEMDWFEQDWTADEDGLYDFNVSLYDEDYNLEDWFWIYNVSLSEGGGGGDEDEWFAEKDHYIDNLTIEIGYDPDTSCDCNVGIEVYVDVFDNETGDYVGSLYDDHTIYNEEEDWFEQEWTADYAGKYDFYVELYDQEYGHEEDNFWIYDVELAEAEQNAAPVIDGLNVADGDEGEELSLSVDAHDDDNDTLTYSWDFGDGKTASGENVKHTWADDGDYTVTVTVSDGEAEDSESATVYVTNVAPSLSVDGASSGQEAQARSFAADTSDVEADTVSVAWDFGDGETGSGDEVTHTWTDDGTYTVTVTASDEDGGETTETFNISISNRAPTLQVSASPTSGDEGDTFAFSAAASDVTDDTVSVTWDFGDGQTANGLAVTHTFTDDGTFVVEVIASDEDGGVTSEKLFITIANVAPTLTNLQLPSSVKQGEPVTVSIEATDPGDDEVTIIWNWGDDTTDEGGTVTHTYDKVGTYTVTVCATDDDGGEDCQQATIPIELLQQLEDDGGLLPGFGLLSALAMLGLLAIFRRR
jgi:PKD repeat protein